jgi:hypothetical protein
MEYLLIVFDDPVELEKMLPDVRAFTHSLATTGNLRAGNLLEPVTTATTVRLRGGKRLVCDGPFADGKEHLVGYYLIAAADLDEAIAIAERVPSARGGAVEVRPVRRHS